MIKLGTSDMAKAYVGSTEVSKVYLGSELVYTKEVLPYDAEIEYLQGNTGAWIDTGIKASGNLVIRCVVVDYFTSSTTKGSWVFGGRNGYTNKMFGFFTTNSDTFPNNFAYNNKFVVNKDFNSFSGDLTLNIESNQYTINNDTVTFTRATFTSSYNIHIFGLNNAGTHLNNSIKIKNFYISNGTQTLDFIPVRVGQVGYLYDRVSKQLFGSAGSGSFTLGNDITV